MKNASRMLCLVAVMIWTGLAAQQTKKLVIHFDSDSYELSAQAKHSIDSLLSTTGYSPANCKISIVGFTDSIGSMQYNGQLSLNRSNATAEYFRSRGFNRTSCAGKSEHDAVADNATEKGKSLNRRVEITFTPEPVKINSIGAIKPEEEHFTVNAEEGAMLPQSSGTVISIPPDAFVDKNGNVVKGAIDVAYREYRDPVDFLLGNIPMTVPTKNGTQPFNSAGMFRITAMQGDQQVFLGNGKDIHLDFAVTQNLPDLNFYRFDTLNGKWTELQPLTDAKGKNIVADSVDRFAQSPCNSFYFVANCGQYYLSRPGSLHDDYIYYDSIQRKRMSWEQQIVANNAVLSEHARQLDTLRENNDRTLHHYRVKAVSSGKGKTIFNIACQARSNNEFAPLRRISWLYEDANLENVDAQIYAKKWTSCDITYNTTTKLFTIVLSDSAAGAPVKLENVQMVFRDKVKRKDRDAKRAALYADYQQVNTLYQAALNGRAQSRENLKTIDAALRVKNDSLQRLANALPRTQSSRDSIAGFWGWSRSYMAGPEMTLKLADWLTYFDAHHPEMKARYDALAASPRFKGCAVVAQQNVQPFQPQAVSAMQGGSELNSFMKLGGSESTMQKNESIETTKQVFQSLSIPSLGVYNCDQVSRLQQPMAIDADYTDENGKPLTITLIYIVDDKFNGILRYDGFMGNSPSHFVYSAASKNTMIAFDENFTPYLFDAEHFAKIANGTKHYTFALKKIDKMKQKEELQQQMTTR